MMTSISSSGVKGYSPTMNTTSRSASSSPRVSPNRSQISAMVGPSRAAIHGTMPSRRRTRSPAVTAAPRGGVHVPTSGFEPADHVVAQLVGTEHLGVVEEGEHETTEGLTVAYLHPEQHLAIAAGAGHGLLAQMPTGRQRLVGVHRHLRPHRLLGAELPGTQHHTGVGPGGRDERFGLLHVDVALDALHPEGAGLASRRGRDRRGTSGPAGSRAGAVRRRGACRCRRKRTGWRSTRAPNRDRRRRSTGRGRGAVPRRCAGQAAAIGGGPGGIAGVEPFPGQRFAAPRREDTPFEAYGVHCEVQGGELVGARARDRAGRTPRAGSGSPRSSAPSASTGRRRSGMPIWRRSSLSRSKARRKLPSSSG